MICDSLWTKTATFSSWNFGKKVVDVWRILSINGGWESNIGYPIGISVIFYIRCPNLIEIGPGEGKLHVHPYLASTKYEVKHL